MGLLVLLCFLIPGTRSVRSPQGSGESGPPLAEVIPEGAEVGQGAVSAAVVDASGEPVADAELRFTDPEGVLLRRARTDGQGRVRVGSLPAEPLQVEARGPGFATARAQVTPATGEPTALRLELERTSVLSGQVYGPDGRPAPGAQVTVAGSGIWPPRVVASDEEGRFRIEDLPGGVYEVHARRDGLVAQPREGLSLVSGLPVFVSLRLRRGVALAGEVVEARTGEPIEGASVAVTEELLSMDPRTTTTDAEGRFRVSGLQPQPHRVTASAEGYVARVAEEVTPGKKRVRLPLQRAAAITGVVLDHLHRPVAGARLEVVGRGLSGRPVSLTGPAFGLRRKLTNALQGPPGASEGLPVTDGPVPPIPASTLLPMEEGSEGGLAPEPGLADLAFTTDDRGRFRITGVPPGQVQVVARRRGHAPGITRPRRLTPGQTLNELEIILPEGGTLDGRVVDVRGYPVSRVPVQLQMEREPSPRLTVTEEDGTFEFSGVRGDVALAALPDGQPLARTRLEVPGGERTEVELQLPDQSRSVEGRTVDTRGFPVIGAQVTVRALRADALVERTILTAGDGTFEVTGLPGPPYRLVARHFDYADTRLDGIDPGRGEVTVELQPGARIAGRVMDGFDREALPGAEVTLKRGRERVDRARTGDSGEFEFHLIPAGNYDVFVSHESFAPASTEAELRPGPRGLEDLDLGVLELEPGGSVTGRVTDRFGSPVGEAEVAMGRPPRWDDAVRADAEGRFELHGVPPGPVRLAARHPAAGRTLLPGPVVVRIKDTTEGVVLRLPERYDPERVRVGEGVRTGVAVTVGRRRGAVRITSVRPGSSAERSGLRVGDVLEAVDDVAVRSPSGARELLDGPRGVEAVVDLRRDGRVVRRVVPRERYLPD